MTNTWTERTVTVGVAFIGGGVMPLVLPSASPYWVYIMFSVLTGALSASLVTLVWPR